MHGFGHGHSQKGILPFHLCSLVSALADTSYHSCGATCTLTKKNAHFTQMVCNNFLFDYSIGYRTAFSDAANHTTPWLKFLEDLINFVSSVVLT